MSKIVLLSILLNATTGAPVAVHMEPVAYETYEACGAAAQDRGMVMVHDNIATEYICRKVEDNGLPTPEVKVGPDGSDFDRWLNKQMQRQMEEGS